MWWEQEGQATSSLELYNGSLLSSHCSTTLFIYEDLVPTSLQEDAVWLFSPLLLPFAAPELLQSWRALKIHPVHTPRETLLSLWLLAQSISPTYRELSKRSTSSPVLLSDLGELGIQSHTQWPIFSGVCLDHFLVPLAQGKPFQCDCWSVHTENVLGCLQVMVHELELHCMVFLWVTGRCIPTWVLFIWSLLGH